MIFEDHHIDSIEGSPREGAQALLAGFPWTGARSARLDLAVGLIYPGQIRPASSRHGCSQYGYGSPIQEFHKLNSSNFLRALSGPWLLRLCLFWSGQATTVRLRFSQILASYATYRTGLG